MATHLVQHDDAILRDVVEPGVELVEEDIVAAFSAGAEAAVIRGGQVEIGDTVGDILAAGVVVQPCRTDTGVDEDVHDVFIRECLAMAILRTGEFREHAGNGHRRRGAAAGRVGEIDHVALGQFRIGVAPIAVQGKIRGASGLTRNDDGDARLMDTSSCGKNLSVLTDWADLYFGFLAGLREIMDGGHHRRQGVDAFDDILVLTDGCGECL